MRWSVVVNNFIGALPATLAGVAAIVVAWRAGKKTDTLHDVVNSRMDQLLVSSNEVAHEAGRQEGLDNSSDLRDVPKPRRGPW